MSNSSSSSFSFCHGGKYLDVRQGEHPAPGMARLGEVGCLTAEERGIMEDTYRFLRLVEHRLQVMFDRQTHEMPRDLEEQRTLAIRLGYPPASIWEDRTGPAERFLADYRAQDGIESKDSQSLTCTTPFATTLASWPTPLSTLCSTQRPTRNRSPPHSNPIPFAITNSHIKT